jgi:hypothetical protein
MWDLIAFISLLAFLVFLVLAVLSLVKKKGTAKRNFLFTGLAFVLFIVGINNAPSSTSETVSTPLEETNKEEDSEVAKEEAEKEVEKEVKITPQMEMVSKIQELISTKQAFDAGSYIKGDIPKGEYAFIPFEGSSQYFAEKDSSGNIVDNENFNSFGYVYVHGVGNIENGGLLINPSAYETLGVKSAKEIYQVMNQVEDNYKDSAWYKVGVDIPAGQYVIESYGEGYVAIMSGPVGNNDIVDNEIFNGRYQLTVSDGQYLKISQGFISE